LDAVDRDDKEIASAGLVVWVYKLPIGEDTVLDEDRVQLAGSHPDERIAWRLIPIGGNLEALAVLPSFPQR
jgi:hypothetical protein